MSHPFSESSLFSTVAHAKHQVSLHVKQKEKTSNNIADALSSQEQLLQKIVNTIPESVWQKNQPIMIAGKKKENLGGWQSMVGEIKFVQGDNSDATDLSVIDHSGKLFQVQR